MDSIEQKNDFKQLTNLLSNLESNLNKKNYNELIEDLKKTLEILRYNYDVFCARIGINEVYYMALSPYYDKLSKNTELEDFKALNDEFKTQSKYFLFFLRDILQLTKEIDKSHINELKNYVVNYHLINDEIHDIQSKFTKILTTQIDESLRYSENLEPNNKDTLQPPFTDIQTQKLCNYIVENWDIKTANKWGYIWNFLKDTVNANLTNPTDFETYARQNHNFIKGNPNYDSCNSRRHYDTLKRLRKSFLET